MSSSTWRMIYFYVLSSCCLLKDSSDLFLLKEVFFYFLKSTYDLQYKAIATFVFNHELRESRFHICTLTSVLNITNDFELNRYKSEHSVMHYWYFILSKWITPFLIYFGTWHFLYVHKKINKWFVLPLMDNKRVLLYQTNEGLTKKYSLNKYFLNEFTSKSPWV